MARHVSISFHQEVGYRTVSERKWLDVTPETGSVLLFEHELLHEGSAVTKGTKYTVRVDVLYKKLQPSSSAASETMSAKGLISCPEKRTNAVRRQLLKIFALLCYGLLRFYVLGQNGSPFDRGQSF